MKFSEDVTFVQKVVILHPENKDKFLLVTRSDHDKSRPGDIEIPCGSLHKGELHEDGLKREVTEEVGLDISNIQPISIKTSYRNDDYFIFIGYVADALHDNVKIDTNELKAYQWIDFKTYTKQYPDHMITQMMQGSVLADKL